MRRSLEERGAKIEQAQASIDAKRTRYRLAIRRAEAEHLRSLGKFSKEAGLLELSGLSQREIHGLVILKDDPKERRRWEQAGAKAESGGDTESAVPEGWAVVGT